MDANPNDITPIDGVEIELFERLVHDVWIAPPRAGCGREDIEPARRNYGDAEGLRARVDEVDARHQAPPTHQGFGEGSGLTWPKTQKSGRQYTSI
jgi:hypothetical protein